MLQLDYVLDERVATVLERSLGSFPDPSDVAFGKQVPWSYPVYEFYHVPLPLLLRVFFLKLTSTLSCADSWPQASMSKTTTFPGLNVPL